MMELPEDVLAVLEEFWADEYEADYLQFAHESKNASSI